jgi:hypothetical protein
MFSAANSSQRNDGAVTFLEPIFQQNFVSCVVHQQELEAEAGGQDLAWDSLDSRLN